MGDLTSCSAKLQRTEKAIEDYRQEIDTRKAESYGFASMAAVAYAHIVANILRKKHPKGTEITLAPNPKDIVCRRRTLPRLTSHHVIVTRRSGRI